MRTLLLAAAGVLALDGAALARSPVGLGSAFPVACAAGYHVDAGGNCQPRLAEANRFCPTGLVIQVTYYGWRCNPAPREAY